MEYIKLKAEGLLIALLTSCCLITAYFLLTFKFDLNPIVIVIFCFIFVIKEIIYLFMSHKNKCYQKEYFLYEGHRYNGYRYILVVSFMLSLLALPLLLIPNILDVNFPYGYKTVLFTYLIFFIVNCCFHILKPNPSYIKMLIKDFFKDSFPKKYNIEIDELTSFYNADFVKRPKFSIPLTYIILEYDIIKGGEIVIKGTHYSESQINAYLNFTGLSFNDVFNDEKEIEMFEMYSI